MTSSNDLRQSFLQFFANRQHKVVASSSLVPGNDPTLLFTNAGMVQFKDAFLGREKRGYTRATSSQRCVRAGGKHNDLENVGYTARHHTFFEMLGNFSFGDYFKREAIKYAWEYLTEVLKLPKDKLWITVYEEDDEAAAIWLKDMGVDPKRFSRIGASDNFWAMGDTGPCGPCSEIFYDHGPGVAGGPPGTPDADGDRYIEIWNLVFMQYDRSADGTLTPLPKPSVDTGMGLERLAAVMQGVHSNYEIDLFQNLIKVAADLTHTEDLENRSLRVLADHIRSCSFLITDGVIPSNEGRGYVLRRIIRRAARHGYELGMRDPFFYKMVAQLATDMGAAFPELVAAKSQVERALQQEEERFAETLSQGMKILDDVIAGLSGKVIPGDTVFKLYDTYGFPVDLTADYALKYQLTIDTAGYEKAMAEQRARARAAGQFTMDMSQGLILDLASEFTGYSQLLDTATVVKLLRNQQEVETLNAGDEGMVLLDKTPFYGESGGQAGDAGILMNSDVEFEVSDTQKQGSSIIHIGTVRHGTLTVGKTLEARVDELRRQETAYNHSATHLLHAALRRLLGTHVQQKGSLVNADRLRFDFSHFEAVTPSQLTEIERLVNTQIRANHEVHARIMNQEAARKTGAMALFGEKYGDEVRVLSMGEFSTELCGGTHVQRTGDIGLMKIISEQGIAAGVRRIEAVTGQGALDWLGEANADLQRIAGMLKGDRRSVGNRVEQLLEQNKQLEKELERLKGKLASSQGSDLASQAATIGDHRVLAARLDGVDPKALRDTLDQLKNKLGSAAIVLATVTGDKVSLIAGVTSDLTGRVKAGELVNVVAEKVGGKGGGRPDMAQAGGNKPEALNDALKQVAPWVEQRLKS